MFHYQTFNMEVKNIYKVNVLVACDNWRADTEYTRRDEKGVVVTERKWIPILGGDKAVEGMRVSTAKDSLELRSGEWGPYFLRKMEVRDELPA
jgi:hypothetical protein